MKASYRRFKGVAKMCSQEMKHFDRVLNVYSGLKSTDGERKHLLAAPSDHVKIQFDNLSEMASDILRLYSEGIQRLKGLELHPKLQSEGRRHLIDIYYKEEQMNQFRDSLTRQLEKLRLKIDDHLRGAGSFSKQGVAKFVR